MSWQARQCRWIFGWIRKKGLFLAIDGSNFQRDGSHACSQKMSGIVANPHRCLGHSKCTDVNARFIPLVISSQRPDRCDLYLVCWGVPAKLDFKKCLST